MNSYGQNKEMWLSEYSEKEPMPVQRGASGGMSQHSAIVVFLLIILIKDLNE